MDWTADIHILRRIVALLFALAGLADRAAVAPAPNRRRAMDALSYAEAVAHEMILDMAADRSRACVEPNDFIYDGDDAADATRLAVRLRALAIALLCLMAGRLADRRELAPPPRRALSAKTPALFALTALGPLWADTS